MKWVETTFGEFVDCNPMIKCKRNCLVENCEMEDIDANFKYLYPQQGKFYTGSGSKFQNGDTVFSRITPCLENGKIAQIKGLKGNARISEVSLRKLTARLLESVSVRMLHESGYTSCLHVTDAPVRSLILHLLKVSIFIFYPRTLQLFAYLLPPATYISPIGPQDIYGSEYKQATQVSFHEPLVSAHTPTQ
jgi:hypothetical protein